MRPPMFAILDLSVRRGRRICDRAQTIVESFGASPSSPGTTSKEIRHGMNKRPSVSPMRGGRRDGEAATILVA